MHEIISSSRMPYVKCLYAKWNVYKRCQLVSDFWLLVYLMHSLLLFTRFDIWKRCVCLTNCVRCVCVCVLVWVSIWCFCNHSEFIRAVNVKFIYLFFETWWKHDFYRFACHRDKWRYFRFFFFQLCYVWVCHTLPDHRIKQKRRKEPLLLYIFIIHMNMSNQFFIYTHHIAEHSALAYDGHTTSYRWFCCCVRFHRLN